MRALPFLLLLALAASAGTAPAPAPAAEGATAESYFVVFLRPDPGRKPLAQADRERIQAAHMANIRRMADEGILVAAGPMDDQPTTISGIFVFKTGSRAEALRIADLDPTVVERRNTADVHPWLGQKGMGSGYFQWKRENPEAKDAMASHVLCIVRGGRPRPAGRGPARTAQGSSIRFTTRGCSPRRAGWKGIRTSRRSLSSRAQRPRMRGTESGGIRRSCPGASPSSFTIGGAPTASCRGDAPLGK